MKGRKEKKNEIRKYPDRYGYRARAGYPLDTDGWPAWLGCWVLPEALSPPQAASIGRAAFNRDRPYARWCRALAVTWRLLVSFPQSSSPKTQDTRQEAAELSHPSRLSRHTQSPMIIRVSWPHRTVVSTRGRSHIREFTSRSRSASR